jgi:hypothetical protein
MKIVLIVVILCFFINFISAFSWFNFRSNQQAEQITESSSTRRSIFQFRRAGFQQRNQWRNATNHLGQAFIASNKTKVNRSPLQRIVNRRRYQVQNTTAIQRQAYNINNNSSQIVPQNRFQAIVYQQQHRSINNPLAVRQINRITNNTNNRVVHRRFRYSLATSKNNKTVINSANRHTFPPASLSKSIFADSKSNNSSMTKNNIQPIQSRFLVAKTGLLQALTTKTNGNNGSPNRQHLLADFYYQNKLKALYRRLYEENAARHHLHPNSALRKRDNQSNSVQSDAYYPMVFVRAEPLNSGNDN